MQKNSPDWLEVAHKVLLSRKMDGLEIQQLAPQGKVKYQFSAMGQRRHSTTPMMGSLSITARDHLCWHAAYLHPTLWQLVWPNLQAHQVGVILVLCLTSLGWGS
jgi:hypothetical protein